MHVKKFWDLDVFSHFFVMKLENNDKKLHFTVFHMVNGFDSDSQIKLEKSIEFCIMSQFFSWPLFWEYKKPDIFFPGYRWHEYFTSEYQLFSVFPV